jgi:hypothetical protein
MTRVGELPPIGTRLFAYKRKPVRSRIEGEVVMDSTSLNGRALEVEGRRYASLSEAASKIAGTRRNGWLWWRTEDGRPVGKAYKP